MSMIKLAGAKPKQDIETGDEKDSAVPVATDVGTSDHIDRGCTGVS